MSEHAVESEFFWLDAADEQEEVIECDVGFDNDDEVREWICLADDSDLTAAPTVDKLPKVKQDSARSPERLCADGSSSHASSQTLSRSNRMCS